MNFNHLKSMSNYRFLHKYRILFYQIQIHFLPLKINSLLRTSSFKKILIVRSINKTNISSVMDTNKNDINQ